MYVCMVYTYVLYSSLVEASPSSVEIRKHITSTPFANLRFAFALPAFGDFDRYAFSQVRHQTKELRGTAAIDVAMMKVGVGDR